MLKNFLQATFPGSATTPPSTTSASSYMSRPTDYREALLELYHSYVEHHHDALPRDFGEMAHRVNVLCEFFKVLSECDLGQLREDVVLKGKRRT